MKIVIDDKIPYINGALENYSNVVYMPGAKTTRNDVSDAQALVTRTRTLCNRALLEGSAVRYIATATIGFDHIDTRYCRDAGIEWSNAPGCNAESVNQYVASALFSWAQSSGVTLRGKTIGIVGVGNVGKRVARTCALLGMQVLLNDPPRARAEGPGQFVELQDIREQADIITFHVPLNMDGVDKTFHLADAAFLAALGKCPLLINTCRGEVFETGAVKQARQSDVISGLVIDCWENEPNIDLELLEMVDFATPHIAGYSRDGKANGTTASVRAISRFFGLGIDDWQPSGIESPPNPLVGLDGAGRSEEQVLADAVLATFRIAEDDAALRADTTLFERLRGNYPVRREFHAHAVRAVNVEERTLQKLVRLGFKNS